MTGHLTYCCLSIIPNNLTILLWLLASTCHCHSLDIRPFSVMSWDECVWKSQQISCLYDSRIIYITLLPYSDAWSEFTDDDWSVDFVHWCERGFTKILYLPFRNYNQFIQRTSIFKSSTVSGQLTDKLFHVQVSSIPLLFQETIKQVGLELISGTKLAFSNVISAQVKEAISRWKKQNKSTIHRSITKLLRSSSFWQKHHGWQPVVYMCSERCRNTILANCKELQCQTAHLKHQVRNSTDQHETDQDGLCCSQRAVDCLPQQQRAE